MNKKMMFATYLMTGVVAGTGIGVGIYFILDSKKVKTIPIFSGEMKSVDLPHTTKKIKEYQIMEGNIPFFYLGDTGLNLLSDLIDKYLSYGPEIDFLNNIKLGSLSGLADVEVNGLYSLRTNEILIDTKNLSNIIPITSSYQAKAYNVFQTIFHEYMHHVTYTYLRPFKDGQKNAKAFNDENGKFFLNKAFSDKFIDALHYNSTELWKHNYIKNQAERIIGEPDKITTFEPIANKYSLKDLFERANYGNNQWFHNYSDLGVNNYDWFGGYQRIEENLADLEHKVRPHNLPGRKKLTPIKVKDNGDSTLSYLYSIDELISRKYQQSQMGYQDPVPFLPSGWTEKSASDFLSNTLMYQDVYDIGHKNPHSVDYFPYIKRAHNDLDTTTLTPLDVMERVRFFKDAPFNLPLAKKDLEDKTDDPADKMYDALMNAIGYNDKDNLSLIWSENDSYISANEKIIESFNKNKIKFGGYIPDNNNYNYVGYFVDDNVNGKFIGFPIKKGGFNMRVKKDLIVNTFHDLDSSKYNTFYTTENWINIDNINNKQLFFAANENGVGHTPLERPRLDSLSGDAGLNGTAQTFYSQLNSNGSYTPISVKLINGAGVGIGRV